MRPAVLRFATVALCVLLLAGCTGRTPPTTATPTDATPDVPESGLLLVGLDGRWPIPEAPSRATATAAGYRDLGAAIFGEASLGHAATSIAALDAAAARHLNVTLLPARGSLVLDRAVADALGAREGDRLSPRSTTWGPSRVMAAFEMERVRDCDPAVPAPLCSMSTTASGEAVLALRVPTGSSDLRFHADVVELAPGDFPAEWTGTFVAPSGREVRWHTSATDRSTTEPPGSVDGPLEVGTWQVRFTLVVNHTRAPGAIAGFVTYRTLGFSPFDVELLRLQEATLQTSALIENATATSLPALRVAGIADGLPAGALLHVDDARALLALGEGNVTALLAPARAGASDARLQEKAGESSDPAVSALRSRPMPPRAPGAPDGGAVVLWLPADADITALPEVEGLREPRLAVEGSPVVALKVKESPLGAPAHLLALSPGSPPWRLVPKAFWANESAAYDGMAGGPHLLLLSDDLVTLAGLPTNNATYAKTEIHTAIGPRILFGMGAVEGGPTGAIWASASLVAAVGRPAGLRVVAPLEPGASLADAEARALAAWAEFGVARIVR